MNPLASATSSELQEARERGSFDFLELIVNRISESVAGELNGDTMARLTPEQITLWAYWIFRSEVLDGGHVQLIYNGYGPFIYRNPFAHVMKIWGLTDFAKFINKGHTLYKKHEAEITQERSDEEFMAMYENFEDFDDLDDAFVIHEEEITDQIADHVNEQISQFVTIKN